VVILCLGASLICALFIMPTHLNVIAKEPHHKKTAKELKEAEEGYEKGLFGRMQHRYHSLLDKALRHRYLAVLVLVLLLFGSMTLMATGIVKFEFLTGGGEDGITIKTYMVQGTNLEANLKEMKKLEKIITKTVRKDELKTMRGRVGAEDFGLLDPPPGEFTHTSTELLALPPEKERGRIAKDIAVELRKNIKEFHEQGGFPKEMLIKTEVDEQGPPVGKPINVELRGPDFNVLKKIAAEYIQYLKTVKGVYDIRMDFELGKLEYRYSIDEVIATRSGVSVTDAANALNASFAGAVATNVRQGEEDIDVRVRFPEWARRSKQTLRDVMISNMAGGLIPLNKIARVEKKPGFAFINRLDFKRLVQVQGEVNTNITTSLEVNQLLAKKFKDIEQKYPGYVIRYGGEQEATDESMADLGKLFLLAILIIYIILAVYFESLMLPLVVMCAIPFSLVGVILAVWAHGENLSFMSTLGLFSLAGVIVSNTLVLVQFINNLRDRGMSLKESLLEGGVIRLRPVLLTSGTTVLGLFPTIYGLGGKDYFVAPLSLAFGYGLIFATFITLILIPCFYHIAEDIKGFTARILKTFGITISDQIYNAEKQE
jgi:multidrug efflux pump subunit AcrB